MIDTFWLRIIVRKKIGISMHSPRSYRNHVKNSNGAGAGFTLIELSIVLIIIGLVAGGLLVGQDLIDAAKIRATISQIQKYDTAVNTFQQKYGGLPGDLQESTAVSLGFYAMTDVNPPGLTGYGDGNGLIEGGGTGETMPYGETLAFWRHLTDAALIDGSYGVSGLNQLNALGENGIVTNVSKSLPPAKLGRGNYFIVYAVDAINYYQIQGITTFETPQYTMKNAMTPIEAAAIDTKLDDGLPTSGTIQAMVAGPVNQNAANTRPTPGTQGTVTNCTQNTSVPDAYDTTTSGSTPPGNHPNCGLRVQFN